MKDLDKNLPDASEKTEEGAKGQEPGETADSSEYPTTCGSDPEGADATKSLTGDVTTGDNP